MRTSILEALQNGSCLILRRLFSFSRGRGGGKEGEGENQRELGAHFGENCLAQEDLWREASVDEAGLAEKAECAPSCQKLTCSPWTFRGSFIAGRPSHGQLFFFFFFFLSLFFLQDVQAEENGTHNSRVKPYCKLLSLGLRMEKLLHLTSCGCRVRSLSSQRRRQTVIFFRSFLCDKGGTHGISMTYISASASRSQLMESTSLSRPDLGNLEGSFRISSSDPAAPLRKNLQQWCCNLAPKLRKYGVRSDGLERFAED